MSFGPMPAASYTCCAASRAMLNPTTSRMSLASNVMGRSVVIACALMRTLGSNPWRLAKSVEQTIAAAAPHVGGHAIRRVMTPGHSTGEFNTSSSVTTLRNKAIGLFAA